MVLNMTWIDSSFFLALSFLFQVDGIRPLLRGRHFFFLSLVSRFRESHDFEPNCGDSDPQAMVTCSRSGDVDEGKLML